MAVVAERVVSVVAAQVQSLRVVALVAAQVQSLRVVGPSVNLVYQNLAEAVVVAGVGQAVPH